MAAMKTLLNFFITSVLLLQCCEHINGMATISPSGIAPACLGDQLDLICTTTGNFLEWTIDLIGTSRSPMLAIQSFGENDQMTQIHINSISFVFRRISTEGSLPLSSSLTITPVINSLNGTQVNCEDKETRASSSTVVSITNDPQKVVFTSILEHFEGDIVTVTVEWMEENLIYLYNITVTPQAETTFIGKATVQLKIIYNTFYNVSVITSSPCGSSNVTNLTDLFYTSCENVTNLANELITVVGHQSPAVEGSSVTFSCPLGLELTSSNTSTCTKNGEWEPDPIDTRCNSTTIQTRTTGTEIINMKHSTPQYTEGLRRIEQIAIASVSTFIITSISFFIIGILCNKFCCKQKAVETHTEDENPNLLRANVQPHQQQQLELNTNVAYGLVRHH